MPVASIMTWVENFLNLTNGYYKVASSEGDQFEYLVPIPPGYTSTIKAHWTTDVIVLDPSCSWQTAMMATGPNNSSWDVTLPQSNLSIRLETFHFGMFLLSSNVFIYLPNFSIKQLKCHPGFSFPVQQRNCYGIHCSCGRFRTFCRGST